MYLPESDRKQYDEAMSSMEEQKLETEGDTSNYNLDREKYASIDVAQGNNPQNQPEDSRLKRPNAHKSKRRIFIILVSALLVIITVVGTGLVLRKKPNTKPQGPYVINTQSLDNGTLNQLTVEAGGAKQQLTISPDTLFQNSVNVDKDLTIKGQALLQSAVNIGKDLGVGGNTTVGGNLSVRGQISAGNLNVGSVTIGSLHLSGDLEFNGHLLPTGAAPTIKTSIASGGGTATVEGSDTAGTIIIKTGGNPTVAGELAIISFKTKYSLAPKVQLTPASGAAAKLDYFITRSAGFFTIETTSVASASSDYVFDYFVVE